MIQDHPKQSKFILFSVWVKKAFKFYDEVSGNFSVSVPEFSESQILFEILDFGKTLPENPPKVMPQNRLKTLLEKVSGKAPGSLPGFFDPVSFELEYPYQVRWKVCRDIKSRCNNPPNIYAK